MDRRLLLWLLLSFIALAAYEQLLRRWYPAVPNPAPQGEARAPAPVPEAPTAPPPATPSGTPGAAAGLAAPPGDHPRVTVETDLFRATITTLGARLESFQLKDFRETVARDSPPLDLVMPSPVLPLTAELRGGKSDADVLYSPSTSTLEVHGPQEGEISFTGSTSDGRAIEKHYRFSGNSYLFALDVGGSESGDRTGIILTPISEMGASGGRQSGHEIAIAFANQKVIEKATDKLGEPSEIADALWAGFSAQYFTALAMPTTGNATAWLALSDASPIARVDIPSENGSARFRVFLGPKDRETLAAAGHDLDRALDFGWFWFIAIPLLSALRLLHRVIPNYGVSIILLTTIVKAVTLPLTQASMKSMKAMQKLQPEMLRLRERYKDDQATLQKEVMELYKRHRVNPVSGCLPMLLQLPIFVGLYNALMHAIELRHAPFVLWINDLAAPDRLPIPGLTPIGSFTGIPVLVILMGGSMLLQQWMTPQQGDPAQQRMMMIMPLVFTFISFNFPSGLVLYWLVNNLLSMAQQWYMLRSDNGGARR